MIRYKVTNKKRYSHPGHGRHFYYNKGETIESNDLGIFVLEKKRDAEAYVEHLEGLNLKILRVEAHGRGIRRSHCPMLLRFGITEAVRFFVKKVAKFTYYRESHKWGQPVDNNFLVSKNGNVFWICPKGTMTYKSVTVLD